jgi:uncharacterized protein YjiS (DUF1127 family)
MDDTIRAYIAGFLDGDGSIILQLKPRRDYRYGFQIRATISFYQKRRGRWVLEWLQTHIGRGRIRERPDGIAQYDVEGIEPVRWLLEQVQPYVVAKREQVEQALNLLREMCANKSPTPEEFLEWARKVESYQALNYSKKCRYRAEDVRRFLSSKGWLLPP